jgi:hypothetical protein
MTNLLSLDERDELIGKLYDHRVEMIKSWVLDDNLEMLYDYVEAVEDFSQLDNDTLIAITDSIEETQENGATTDS